MPPTPTGGLGSAFPWGAAIQGGLGLAQMIGGAIGAAKGRKELNKLISGMPKEEADKAIMEYENLARQRALTSPTESAMYKRQMQNIGRSTAMGLRAAQDRRGGLAAASSLARQASDASLGAEVAGEQQQAQRFAQAYAPIMAGARERQRVFQQNVMQPWQIRAQMAGQRAAGGAQTFNIGAGNIFGAGQSLATRDIYKQMYGGQGGGTAGTGGFYNTAYGKLYNG